MNFNLKAPFAPTGDQPEAIRSLISGIKKGLYNQVLLGVTGSGKTYTIANVVARINRPTLVISHNKTLAAQLYQEFHEFFPGNAVCYFVSYYDFYQPEAYIPQTDTYIEKETEINQEIDKLRLSATANLLTRPDCLIVASVSCIYNIGSPVSYGKFVLELKQGMKITRETIIDRLVDLQYSRSEFGFHRGTFRVRGENIDLFLAYEDYALRMTLGDDNLTGIATLDPLNGNTINLLTQFTVYPAKHYLTDTRNKNEIFATIRNDLRLRIKELESRGKKLEAYRLRQKVNYDLEMIEELGYVNGIENYSRYFDGRKPGEPPYTLLDYFQKTYGDNWLLLIDESHMTVPQIRGMYSGDLSRKKTLVEYGFRLPAAMDNRPLKFVEFEKRRPQTIFISATPSDWELSFAKEEANRVSISRGTSYNGIAEQLIRPTGIVDPEVFVRPTENQINDLYQEIISRKKKGERVLVTTLTKKIAEDLAAYLHSGKNHKLPHNFETNDKIKPRVHYLHSDIKTLDRGDILDNLRQGEYDCLIGINLLREGLDLPEVSLVAILDADKEGFLRSETSLIQTMGRAARHSRGTVIMYADKITGSMTRALTEIRRRRKIQLLYNKKHHITPVNIKKPVRQKLVTDRERELPLINFLDKRSQTQYQNLLQIDYTQLPPSDLNKLSVKMTAEMKNAARELNFELAAEIRDKIREIKKLS